jgi:hypothetical protein
VLEAGLREIGQEQYLRWVVAELEGFTVDDSTTDLDIKRPTLLADSPNRVSGLYRSLVSPVPSRAQQFWSRPLVGVLSLVRPDGRLHATPVKAVYLFGECGVCAAALVSRHSVKARLVGSTAARAALTEQDAQGWVSVEGPSGLSDDPLLLARVRKAYEQRFSQPSTWGDVLITIEAEHIGTGG